MGGGSSPPALANPYQTAQQQQAYNTQAGLQSQAGSMVNQSNPYGSLTYSQSGTDAYGNPIYTSSLQLSPAQQSLYNILTGTQTIAGGQGLGLIGGAGYGSSNPLTDIGTETSGIQGQLTNQWLQSQAPWMNQQTQQLDTQLRNQGINPSPTATADPSTWGAYERQMNQLRQTQQMSVAGAVTQFQPTAFQEASSLYMLPASLGMQLSSFGQPTSPGSSLVQTPGLNISPANLEGDVSSYNQALMQEWAAQQQSMGNMMSGLFGAGGNIAGSLIRNPAALSFLAA